MTENSLAKEHTQVQEYYGKILLNSQDLQTNVCTMDEDAIPRYVKNALALVHDEVMARYYGCGLVVPQNLQGMKILDLGCGSGRDCYVLSNLVGENGSVVGVDMTLEQIEVAQKHIDYHTQKYGYKKPNVTFKHGFIEKLHELDLPDNTFDIIISNCVINLSPDKESVLKEAYRVLKKGGEMYFSDVYSDRRIPLALVQNKLLYGECLSGALYWNDFVNMAKKTGFLDPRLVEDQQIKVNNEELSELVSGIKFYSATYRLSKIPDLEPACEDYGQAVSYKGNIPHHEKVLKLDKGHVFEKGRVVPVCGNTNNIIAQSRFAEYFEYYGNTTTHYGIFEGCGTASPFQDSGNNTEAPAASCC
jgi:arsenite methyltransferase